MKVLLVNKYFYQKGGAENSFFQMAELLRVKGHDMSFFSMHHERNMVSPYDKYFVSHIDYESQKVLDRINAGAKLLYSVEARQKIEALLAEHRPDIAHLNNIYHQISPSILHSLKKFRVPAVMTLRDYKVVCASYSMLHNGRVCEACKGGHYLNCARLACVNGSRAKSLLNTFELYLHHNLLRIYDIVDIFISPSRFLKAKIEEMGFKGKVVYLPNFVDLSEYVPAFGPQDNTIVYFGRLSREKGLLTLIDAMQGLPVHLKIVGEGPMLAELQERVRSLRLNNIEFTGYLSGQVLKDEISRAIAVVLPSECYENNPRSILEGFALGKPAIGARIGGIPELVIDGQTGWTFHPGNAGMLHDRIQQLARNSADIVQFGKNGRRLIETGFDQESHYKNLMRIYQTVLEKPR